jgi:predicted ATP-grasp superfamily ATP-dependent carboligase
VSVTGVRDESWRGRRLRVLLTEASSLSALHTVYALARFRPVLDALDPEPIFSLVRCSRHVRYCSRCPHFAADPAGYLRTLLATLRAGRHDVLLPVHDQVFLVARFRDLLSGHVGLAVPEFEALAEVQSKASFSRLLDALRLPQPPTQVVWTADALKQMDTPCYVKLAHATAGRGVWYVRDGREAEELVGRLERDGLVGDDREVLVQQPAPGTLCVVQSVFRNGRLVGGHSYRARSLGVGGSAWARESVAHPVVLEHLGRLGAHLRWHGALMLDYLFDEATGRPAYIDANPRIGETLNATLSGVNLCALLVEVSLGRAVERHPPGRAGVRSHNLLNRLLAAGQAGATRRQLLTELARAWGRRGHYARSQDELTRPGEDPLSLLPALVLTTQLLLDPRAADRVVRRTVERYALTGAAVQAIRQLPADGGPDV